MTKLIFLLIAMLASFVVFAQSKPDPKYFNEVPPGTTPKVFASGTISKEAEFEFGSVFSNDRTEFYYAVEIAGKTETRMMKFKNGKWSAPVTILFHERYSFNDPFLSPDHQKLFFISNRPISGVGPEKDYDIWFVERKGETWSEPKNAGENINSEQNEYYISFAKSGKMYFSSNKADQEGGGNYDIYTAEFKNGQFQPAHQLSAEINTSAYEADVYVAPDESYVVFSTKRPDGVGHGDLYVSFRTKDGTWSSAKNLGAAINTESNDFCPYVSPDGKYLFYASRGDIYWVSTEMLKKLK